MEGGTELHNGNRSVAALGAGEYGESCAGLLTDCAQAASAASGEAADDPELGRTLRELRLLCDATREALAMDARTTRELRLICAAICHLCSELCRARPEPWAQQLAALSRRCAHACRQVVALPPPRAA